MTADEKVFHKQYLTKEKTSKCLGMQRKRINRAGQMGGKREAGKMREMEQTEMGKGREEGGGGDRKRIKSPGREYAIVCCERNLVE